MVAVKNASNLILSHARDRKYVLVIAFSAIFSILYNSLFNPVANDPVANAALTLLFGWMALRCADLAKGVLLSFEPAIQLEDKAVFITGCSSGFGRELAKKLDSLGMTVFAGCRNVTDDRAKQLKESTSSRLQLVKVDVTKDDEMDAAVEFVKKNLAGKVLWAVVCNAGIFSASAFDWGEKRGVNLLRHILETNTIGAVRTINSFLPLLRKTANSRVVITSSIAGRIPCPSQAAYSASKFALRGFASALRIECRKFNVHVSLIEPIYYGTCLVEQERIKQQLDSAWMASPSDVKDSYSAEQKDSVVTTLNTMLRLTHENFSPVIDALTLAITTRREPDHFYRICSWPESILFYLNEALPSELTDDYLAPFLIGPTVSLVSSFNKVTNLISTKSQTLMQNRQKLL